MVKEPKIHPEVINFHEVAIEVITITHESDALTRKDLQWLRADARMVLTRAQNLLDAMEGGT